MAKLTTQTATRATDTAFAATSPQSDLRRAQESLFPSGISSLVHEPLARPGQPSCQPPFPPQFNHDFTQVPLRHDPNSREFQNAMSPARSPYVPLSNVIVGFTPARLQLQPKLTVNEPGDQYEQEADRIAEQVMRMPAHSIQRQCACGSAGGGECDERQKTKENSIPSGPKVQRRANAPGLKIVPPSVHAVLNTPGQPLDDATREFFEPRFGHDLSHVRVHTDTDAAQSAVDVQAQAYAAGNQIVIGNTPPTRGLLAHEIVHTLQQGTDILCRQPSHCSTRFSRARNFPDYISLLREAETRLIASGFGSVEDRVHVKRGIYYGTTWSADFGVEHSPVRNAGFQVYTASIAPDDPRLYLDCGLFESLRDSQDLIDGRRKVDVGHLMIGLDARRSWTARNVNIPTQGGTGLDISTWLGDLGGGAGMLAYRRVSAPTTNAMTVFKGTDFGGPINLEGDVAGFSIARDTSKASTEPVGLTFAGAATIADALASYLMPTAGGASSSEWNDRCRTFMEMKGGKFDSGGTLLNRAALVSDLKIQIEQFACWYLVNRMRQTGRLSLSDLQTASLHIGGASNEIAAIFVDALIACQSTPGANLAASGTGPTASSIGTGSPTACSIAIRSLEAAQSAEKLLERGEGTLRGLERGMRELQKNLPF